MIDLVGWSEKEKKWLPVQTYNQDHELLISDGGERHYAKTMLEIMLANGEYVKYDVNLGEAPVRLASDNPESRMSTLDDVLDQITIGEDDFGNALTYFTDALDFEVKVTKQHIKDLMLDLVGDVETVRLGKQTTPNEITALMRKKIKAL